MRSRTWYIVTQVAEVGIFVAAAVGLGMGLLALR
jgi:hypothetical protein